MFEGKNGTRAGDEDSFDHERLTPALSCPAGHGEVEGTGPGGFVSGVVEAVFGAD